MARPTALSSISLSDLHRELARRGKQVAGLRERRDALLKEVAAINAKIGDEPSMPVRRGPGRPKGSKNRKPGAAPVRGRGWPKNAMSLVDALAAALKDKTMGVAEAADAVRTAGYKSSAASVPIMVNGGAVQAAVQEGGEGEVHGEIGSYHDIAPDDTHPTCP